MFTLVGSADSTTSSETVRFHLGILMFGMELFSVTVDGCDEDLLSRYLVKGFQCPIAPGLVAGQGSAVIPSFAIAVRAVSGHRGPLPSADLVRGFIRGRTRSGPRHLGMMATSCSVSTPSSKWSAQATRSLATCLTSSSCDTHICWQLPPSSTLQASFCASVPLQHASTIKHLGETREPQARHVGTRRAASAIGLNRNHTIFSSPSAASQPTQCITCTHAHIT